MIVGLYYGFTYVKFGRGPKKTKKSGALGTGLDLDDLGIADPLAHARALAEQSDFREAVRYVYIASLRKLAGSGLVTLQENRTNWEYQRSLRSRSATVYDTLLPGTRLFDRIWYVGKTQPQRIRKRRFAVRRFARHAYVRVANRR